MEQRDPTPDSAGTEVERFDRDDPAYLQWVATKPDGFVLDVPRGDRSELLLHRAGCERLAAQGDAGGWTVDSLKLASGEKWRLDDWADGELGRRPPRCPVCSPDA